MGKFFLISLACCFLLQSCNEKEANEGKTKVLVSIQAAYHKKIYLQQQPLNDEQAVNLDSGIVQSGLDSFVFYVPKGEERLYAITVAETAVRIPFIIDNNNVEVYYNYATHRYGFKNSPASAQLKEFTDGQVRLAKDVRHVKFFIDSMQKTTQPSSILKDSIVKFDSLSAVFFNGYKNFADTVHSPAAFFAVYDVIQFGNDRKGLKAFITRAATRFPQHQGMQTLAKNVLEFINVFDNQYKVGDTLPALVLPDEFGINFSTASLKGKWAVINVWSAVCDNCDKYAVAIAKAKQLFPPSKFEAVNVALDDQRQPWLAAIQRKHYNWPQLIDEKMWSGVAFKTLKFDSIPYNFIVAPDGRLAAKAVPADSIVIFLQHNIQ